MTSGPESQSCRQVGPTMAIDEFEQLVADALDSIPPEFEPLMENLAVLVDDKSPPGRVLGLYQGVPLTSRGVHYSGYAPDRITIYMASICSRCSTRDEAVRTVRRVVIHEIGHHFGISDRRLRELGF
jgi:predicted Zn-dependent protease with MMP-like domain